MHVYKINKIRNKEHEIDITNWDLIEFESPIMKEYGLKQGLQKSTTIDNKLTSSIRNHKTFL